MFCITCNFVVEEKIKSKDSYENMEEMAEKQSLKSLLGQVLQTRNTGQESEYLITLMRGGN